MNDGRKIVSTTINLELEVIATYRPGTMSITSGPPDAWEQGEGPEVEIVSISYEGMDVVFAKKSEPGKRDTVFDFPDRHLQDRFEAVAIVAAEDDEE